MPHRAIVLCQRATSLVQGIAPTGMSESLANTVHACSFCRAPVFVDHGSEAEALAKTGGDPPTLVCHRCAIGDTQGWLTLPLPAFQRREIHDAVYQLKRQTEEAEKIRRRSA